MGHLLVYIYLQPHSKFHHNIKYIKYCDVRPNRHHPCPISPRSLLYVVSNVLALLKKGRQSASGDGIKLPGICPGTTTIVTPKSVGSKTTNGQMKATSKGEFDGFPGRRDGPNHANRLDRASRVLSARTPSKKPQAKKIPSALSVETAYELIPSKAAKRPNQRSVISKETM